MTTPRLAIQLKEWECIAPEGRGTQLAGVFLTGDAEVKHTARALSTSGKLRVSELREGLSIEASSYVGRITLGDIQITIHPKITGMPLLRLLRYAYGLRNLEIFDEAEYSSEELAFQELLLHQLVAEVNELVARGLHRRYVRTDHELGSPRGRIDVQKIARQGGSIQVTLPCTYHPRLEDCLINQVLLQGLHLAARLTNDSTLRIRLYRLANLFQDSVSSIRLDHNALKQLHREMERLNSAYIPAITIIEILLASEGISLDESLPRIQLSGFLFDMNLFFQALLSLPPHMLYQLAIYALSQPGGVDAAILYPTVQDDAKEARIVIRDPLHQSRIAQVILRPVNLLSLDELLSAGDKIINDRARAAFARQLAFGDRVSKRG